MRLSIGNIAFASDSSALLVEKSERFFSRKLDFFAGLLWSGMVLFENLDFVCLVVSLFVLFDDSAELGFPSSKFD